VCRCPTALCTHPPPPNPHAPLPLQARRIAVELAEQLDLAEQVSRQLKALQRPPAAAIGGGGPVSSSSTTSQVG
jgi:hypothetical protein